MFIDYVLAVHRNDLMRILEDPEMHNSYCVNIDFLNLFENDPNIGDSVLCDPKNTISNCDTDLIDAQKRLLNNLDETSGYFMLKQNVHTRFYGLPVCPELHRITIPKNKDMGCFLKLTGTAVRVTQARMLEYKRNYKCNKCHFVQVVEGIYEQRYVIKAPNKCTNPELNCRSQSMTPVHMVTRENCKDYQELKVQEQVNKLTVGGIPGSIWVTLEDDLVDKCKPGDDVSICGTVLRRWNPISANKKCDVELVFKANHLEVCNAQKAVAVSIAPDVIQEFDEFWKAHETCPMKGRDVILATVCPKVYGLYMVKLALTLTVITGSSHNVNRDDLSPKKNSHNSSSPKDDRDRSVRGQCHLLLVGDPGTGKSQLLKAGSTMLSRSVITSGSGSTKAGLTCTAMREDGEWQLEAGALVLADGGACFIDELAQMREHDRASIHEAMEQQTISVAKAGIICKLNTRCAVIAACNPKGNYDTEQLLSVNVSLGTPLLSRFDLIFILLDTQNSEWDNLVSDYVLFGKTSKALPKGWPLEKLQLYMSLIGPFEVRMTQDTNTVLRAYYVRQRKAANRDPSRTTVRMLDSLVRLTQAHAKLMYRHETLVVDAVTAVSLVDLSMQDCTLSDTTDGLHTSFSFYPDLEYLKMAKKILSNLTLYEIWHSELTRYAKMLNISRQELENNVENNITKHFVKNIMADETVKDSEEIVVESSFFHNNSKCNENTVVEKDGSSDVTLKYSIKKEVKSNSKVIKAKIIIEDTNKSDDDLDSILNVDFKMPARVNKTESRDTVVEKENTNLLLAQTLKKHSKLYKRNNTNNIGIITGKQKRRRTKSNKTPTAKKIKVDKPNKNSDSELQAVLNELNSNSKKKKGKQKVIKRVNKNTNNSASSSEGEMDETKFLNCLPSVNDDFSIMNCGSDEDIFEQAPQYVGSSKVEAVKDISIALSEPNEDCIGECAGPSTSNIPTNNMDNNETPKVRHNVSKVSPINANTLKKLKQFSFTKVKSKSDDGQSSTDVSHESMDSDLFNLSDSKDLRNKDIDHSGTKCDKKMSATELNCDNENISGLLKDICNKTGSNICLVANNSTCLTKSKDCDDNTAIKCGVDSVSVLRKSKSFSRPGSGHLSQKSIFENEDEDYESLDL